MWDIKTIAKDFIKTRNLQQFINNRFKDFSVIQLNPDFCSMIEHIQTKEGIKYRLDRMALTIWMVEHEYLYDDMRKTDVVLDIGGGIGAFSLKIAKKVSKVYAVEPILTETLKDNIKMNDIQNITVLEKALGEGILNLDWMGNLKTINGSSLIELINLCGGHVDFLKIDCEGGEWCIKPEELKGIRRIEIEVHNFEGKYKLTDFLRKLDKAGFKYKYEITVPHKNMIIHATMSGFTHKPLSGY